MMMKLSLLLVLLLPQLSLAQSAAPLKVFIMVGQSNMQGHGYMNVKDDATGQFRNGTLEWMIQKFPKEYNKLKSADGSWKARPDVWITYNRQNIENVRVEVNQFGNLLPGFGGDPGQTDQMGPELGFGWTMAEALNKDNVQQQQQQQPPKQQILLLKVAWGGRSLAVDFRPPSSGGVTGLYYETLMAQIFRTLSRLPQLFPKYATTSIGSYELAGFVWHQGWNDGCDVNMTAEYEFNLANLIRDVRTDLGVSKLPVSIGVSGFNGYTPEPRRDAIIAAQFAVANATKYPEFAGTVVAVETRGFVRPPPLSPGTQSYHWWNNCETYWLVGKAMAEGMIQLLRLSQSSSPPVNVYKQKSLLRNNNNNQLNLLPFGYPSEETISLARRKSRSLLHSLR